MTLPAARGMRIDKLLWFLRLARTRPLAQAVVGAGHIRLNGRRVERAHQAVGVGDVLVIPVGPAVRVIELISLPVRRGPAAEAQACYRLIAGADHRQPDGASELDEHGQSPIAAAAFNDAIGDARAGPFTNPGITPGERDPQS